MQNDNENVELTEDNNQYIETIKKMKESMVDRADYDKLKRENKELLDSVLNGADYEAPAQEEKVDINKLREDLFAGDNNNLEFVEKALKLRTELIENGEPDPFLPVGKQITPTDDDIASAERVAKVLQECVDYAQGDSQIFTTELQRRTIDTNLNVKRK